MSARGCEGACVNLDMTKNAKTSMFHKQNSTKSVDGTTNKAKGTTTTCSFKMPSRSELSPIKLFKHIGGKMAAVVKMMSSKGSRRSCRKVTNSSEKTAISKSLVIPNIDSHRAEAIDDCIQFINMSSSLPRSNSVS
ncbi:PREDICTED: josephin-like protein [Nicotiana attenuata]|uniref:Josephin-like protein n=1 Tax=Nicotiana attenuata TaxID=49451 RepID=A0A1J6KJI4_NICAT|nr:PREDICTED: josephin-like protein [Nicotiana attenuata]OIT19441.1 hypothetical protein A4A49_41256 [Nicotiana attenuata]